MIYTLTTNPSIDYIMRLDEFCDGKTLRSTAEEKYAGGKGIMVAKILKNLGDDPINLGFLGGFTGEFIKKELARLEIKEKFTKIAADTRINVKLKYDTETEINAQGPDITKEEIEDFYKKLEDINKDDYLIISGSLPKSLGSDFYKEVIEKTGCKFSIDIANKEVLDYLKYKPVLIKPNEEELANIFETEISSEDDLIKYAKKLNSLGAKNVIVSLGAAGSIFVDDKNIFKADAIKGDLINSVGAGDSMVGGFIYAISKGHEKLDAYKLAIACGTATAFSPDIASRKKIEEMSKKVEVKEIGN
ncbi:1-phosphofructokinase [Anaerococcus prevotii]|uniref:Tagatose-6-phosphate kinase n=1 Tax=Anaerococcus prevotii ACS-065-V-Col13 TaxID=879305 RepID=F0GTM8_9FIRM|nr:1-phosphofructokinase [Anaerococcus prevotii]EGC82835.1 1-phosphofructokinase [Anaerococcus prevotii ACS-065-V-Col13]